MVGGEEHDDFESRTGAGQRPPGDNETWWWNDTVQVVIKAKKEAMKMWETPGRQR